MIPQRYSRGRRTAGLAWAGLVALAAAAGAGTVISTNSGNWGSAGTWDPGVPGPGDDVFIAAGTTVTMTNLYQTTVNSLSVSGLLTHAANTTSYKHRLNLRTTGDLVVSAGGRVDVTAMGYSTGNGPGTPIGADRRCGASHGGNGAYGNTATLPGETYDSLVAPTNLGSGGTYPAGGNRNGGGAILLDVGGAAQVDGVICANGTNSFGTANGGGAGGSVWLTAASLGGSGTIEANGGPAVNDSSSCGAGGGGRVAVVLTNSSSFGSVALKAQGGAQSISTLCGAAGTVYLRTQDQGLNEGTLVIDTAYDGNGRTELSTSVTDTAVGDVIIRNKATLQINGGQTLTVYGSFSNGYGFATQPNGTLRFGGQKTATLYGNVTCARLVCTNAGKTVVFEAGRTNTVDEALTLAGDAAANLLLRSSLDGSNWYLSVKGTAAQSLDYVDVRDSNAKVGYANTVAPVRSLDSGNNSNWVFAAIGETATWGGTVDSLWSRGGNWELGRAPLASDAAIVIPGGCAHYPVLDKGRELPRFEMRGGSALGLGGYGLSVRGDALLGGTLAATGTETVAFFGNVDFTGGTLVPARSTVVIGGSSTQAVIVAGQSFHALTVVNTAASVTIQDAVTAVLYRSVGASVNYGGDLEVGEFRAQTGGSSVTQTFGAGVACRANDLYLLGAVAAPLVLGGAGGADWSLTVSNVVSVRNVDVSGSKASGGRPIHAAFSRDGGQNPNWVFDADCRIWTGATNTSFTNDANWLPVGAPTATSFVYIDDPHPARISAPVTVYRLMLGGSTQATLEANAPVSIREDFAVLAGGLLTHGTNLTQELNTLAVAVTGRLTLATGGRIDASGKGYWRAKGPGAPLLIPADGSIKRSGGSHGGRGAQGSYSAPGATYGSIIAPTNLGSGGADYGSPAGGGAIRLTVGGGTSLEGSISANGTNQDVTANGGAAGGSVYLTTATLAGSGTIQANGAPAWNDTYNAGAGGGGRVAVVLTATESFGSVVMQARGGPNGANSGGAGTVYRATAAQAGGRGTVLVDNGGLAVNGYAELPGRLSGGLATELARAALVVTNTNTRLVVTTNATVGDLLVHTNATLTLGNSLLTVRAPEHWLDNAGKRGAGYTNRVDHYDQVLWSPLQKTLMSVR